MKLALAFTWVFVPRCSAAVRAQHMEWRPKREKIDVKKQHVFDIDFYRVRGPFSKDFWVVFRRKRGTDFELRVGAANPKNSDFIQENAYF